MLFRSEEFLQKYNESVRQNDLLSFRKKHRQTHVLLMDDVQFLADRNGIQEEFFHTFNALHKNQRQIVLACDRPAGEIPHLDPRLLSRFEWGLVAELQPPERERGQTVDWSRQIRLSEAVWGYL